MEFMHWLDGPIDYARVYLADNIRNLGLYNDADDPEAFSRAVKELYDLFPDDRVALLDHYMTYYKQYREERGDPLRDEPDEPDEPDELDETW